MSNIEDSDFDSVDTKDWRSKPPTKVQLEFLDRLCPDAWFEEMTRGEAHDVIQETMDGWEDGALDDWAESRFESNF
jgi:hypothetical protein